MKVYWGISYMSKTVVSVPFKYEYMYAKMHFVFCKRQKTMLRTKMMTVQMFALYL